MTWLRMGEGRRAPRATLWTYRWKAYWFDLNWRRQETLYPVSRFEGQGGNRLIFVLGFWRSGTTLLHELLAAGPGMAAPRTWQCMNPSGFRVAGAPDATHAVTRPMDAVLVDALSPQEDEFALLARGAPSVYRVWLDPQRWDEVSPALEQDTWLSLPESAWLADWRTFLGWCMPESATHLVIKSPNHLFRLKALRRKWPGARFVWTLRDPVETWQSNRKMWRAMTAMYGLWEARAEDLDRLLFKAMAEYLATLRWAAESLQAHVCRYLDFGALTNDSALALQSIVEPFQLDAWASWQPLLQPSLARSAGRARDTYSAAPALPASAEGLIADIRRLHEALLHDRR